jgi:hypothetical protein
MKKAIVISHFGSQRLTAVALNVKQPTVCAWPDDLPFSVLGRIAVFQPRAWLELNQVSTPTDAASFTEAQQ